MPHTNYQSTVLLVDDNQVNLNLLTIVLGKLNAKLICAFSGADALIKTNGEELALAIVDVRMPEMSGYELAVKLNEGRADNKVPVIFLTANHFDREEELKGYSSGAVDFIVKPFSQAILLSKVSVFLDLFKQKKTILRNAKLLNKSFEDLTKAQQIAHVGSWEYDYKSDEMKCSDETFRIFGFQPGEIEPSLGLFYSMVHKDDYKSLMDRIEDVKKFHIPLNIDLRILYSNGGQGFIHEQAEMTFDDAGLPSKWIGTVHDITQHKKIEEELQKSLEQQQQLSKHIEEVRENERLNISRELHDDLGQALTAVKIDLEIIRQQTADEAAKEKLQNVKALVGNTIRSVQRITSQLRPEIIEDLGLEAAIDWYTKEFSQRYGIDVFLDFESGIPIANDDALPLFRIMQESLTNIARHAKATHIEILLSQQDDFIQFTVTDNGVGISEDEINSKKSFGIMSMKERAASLGGTFSISRRTKFGSKILILFPINKG